MSGTVISRRKFVAWVTGGIGSVISAVVDLPAKRMHPPVMPHSLGA